MMKGTCGICEKGTMKHETQWLSPSEQSENVVRVAQKLPTVANDQCSELAYVTIEVTWPPLARVGRSGHGRSIGIEMLRTGLVTRGRPLLAASAG